MGFAAICFPLGVGFEMELGGSPGPTWMVELLYRSSLGIAGSFTTLTWAGLPGFLLYSILSCVNSDQPVEKNRVAYVSPILRFNDPRRMLLSCVKNSVLKTQFTSGSGSCGEPAPIENQSSLSVEQLMNLTAPTGIVLSA
jgi:hypothetical protein